ncbi:hypothetical protein [Arcobacter sp. CECT 9188]|uniref:hypothetical protein n=1 Tax=Arcobacter sp. CECT 9188 TaxID=2044505 RepID=UPI000DE9B62E|nr:hypothetical protein [Arcobacter sp. CECT 9188]RBQ26356.1 hypothetical protein CRU88_07730 [Arcobacter sp. CECT 9188]
MSLLKKTIISCLFLVSFAFASNDIYMVQKGALNFNKNITIEKAFKDYKYFDEIEWESFVEDDIRFVQVVSKLSYQYLFNNATDDWTSDLDGYFLVYFILKDKVIIPYGVGLIYLDKETDELISEKYTDKLNIDQSKLLDIFYDIYNNEPIRHLYN